MMGYHLFRSFPIGNCQHQTKQTRSLKPASWTHPSSMGGYIHFVKPAHGPIPARLSGLSSAMLNMTSGLPFGHSSSGSSPPYLTISVQSGPGPVDGTYSQALHSFAVSWQYPQHSSAVPRLLSSKSQSFPSRIPAQSTLEVNLLRLQPGILFTCQLR